MLNDRFGGPTLGRRVALSELRGKRIAVDISIYMHRYAASNLFVENIFAMLTAFRVNGIHALFVFDGAMPSRKAAEVAARRRTRVLAEHVAHDTVAALPAWDLLTPDEQDRAQRKLSWLNRQMTVLTKPKSRVVQELITGFGFACMVAEEEADRLCARLARDGVVWACLSDDTDMFAHGATRVLRYFSLLNQAAVLYELADLLAHLNMDLPTFQWTCAMAGAARARMSGPATARAPAPMKGAEASSSGHTSEDEDPVDGADVHVVVPEDDDEDLAVGNDGDAESLSLDALGITMEPGAVRRKLTVDVRPWLSPLGADDGSSGSDDTLRASMDSTDTDASAPGDSGPASVLLSTVSRSTAAPPREALRSLRMRPVTRPLGWNSALKMVRQAMSPRMMHLVSDITHRVLCVHAPNVCARLWHCFGERYVQSLEATVAGYLADCADWERETAETMLNGMEQAERTAADACAPPVFGVHARAALADHGFVFLQV